MKIHWLSNAPWSCTGYGNQTRVFTQRLADKGHQVSITAFYGLEGAQLRLGDITVFPKGFHPYGQDIAAANARMVDADILISLIDAWVCQSDMLQLHNQRWVPWFPVDSEPLPPAVYRQVVNAWKRIVFSHFAEKMLDQAGLDYYYVPHGIDTKVMIPYDKAESRKELGLPEDAYVVGMVAANKGNPSRKAFCEQIAGFQILKAKHPEAVLYIHALDGAGGQDGMVNIPEYCKGIGLEMGRDVRFCNQHQYLLSYADEWMAKTFSAFDVMMNVSTGEGFGIPIVEAQSCGTPVIVGDWTSMSELVFAGRKVDKKDAAPQYSALGAFQYVPRLEAIGALLLEEYNHPSSTEKARQGALAYDADLVVETYWEPVLAKIKEEIESGGKLELVQF